MNSAPNIEIAIISVKAVSGYNTFSTAAIPIPLVDSSNAFSGVPLRVRRPSADGAWPARDRLNIMRVVMYSWLFIADSAATSTMKLMTSAAPGIPSACITFTKGLPPLPASSQGTMARISASVSR
ncbi:hypothetical protein D9M68_968900 [compost metagenome]